MFHLGFISVFSPLCVQNNYIPRRVGIPGGLMLMQYHLLIEKQLSMIQQLLSGYYDLHFPTQSQSYLTNKTGICSIKTFSRSPKYGPSILVGKSLGVKIDEKIEYSLNVLSHIALRK